ncbi:MAG TPA: hypothetical protein VGM94_02735 [Galbitalea sp.]|jgi:hypothetical protein
MTLSLSNGTVTHHPVLRVGHESTNDSRNILHDHLDGSIGVSLRPDLPRAGTEQYLFDDVAAAEAARADLAAAGVWTFTDDYAELSFNFVREGALVVTQSESRATWTVSIGYREVP